MSENPTSQVSFELYHQIHAPIVIIDSQGMLLFCNRSFLTLSGYPEADLINHPIWEIPAILASDAEVFMKAFPLLSPDLLTKETVYTLPTKSGERRTLKWRNEVVTSEDSSVVYIVSSGQDITDTQKEADLKLSEKARYHQMFVRNPAVQLIINAETNAIIDANPAAAQFYATDRDKLRTLTLDDLTASGEINVQHRIEQAHQKHRVYFLDQHRRADGRTRDVEIYPGHLQMGQADLLYLIIKDVTPRNRLEKALRDSETRYRRLLETMQEGLAIQNQEGINTYVNQRLCDMLGYERDEMVGAPIEKFVMPDEIQKLDSQMEKRYQGTSGNYELTFQHREGNPIYALVAATPVMSSTGQYRGSFGVITDITERKQMEQDLIESNAELDAFAHTVAHDLKNPIAVMMGFSNVLETGFMSMSDEEMKEYLTTISRTSEKMINIIDELLMLSEMRHTDTVDMQRLDTNHIVEEALQRLSYMANQYSATIEKPDRSTWHPAMGHAGWIEEIWVNYISNAMKYGGQPPQIWLGSDLLPDGMVKFWVKDNGKGIPDDKLASVFTPFTRLNQVRVQGHGLGLSIVQRIVQKLGGEVNVESTLGEGSVFSFTLPAAEATQQ